MRPRAVGKMKVKEIPLGDLVSSYGQGISKSAQVTIRKATPEDQQICGEICYEAFRKINADHNFPPDFPAASLAVHILSTMFSHPGFYCVVLEQNGRIAGSNCLDERAVIAGVGPITVAPAVQNARVGRKLLLSLVNSSWRKWLHR